MYRYAFNLQCALTLIVTLLASFLLGQEPAVFINRSIDLPVQNDSDYSLAVADLNGDYRDDIIRQSTNSWQIILQKQDGSFFGEVKDIPKPFTALTTNITDIDGDYIPEILMSGNKTGISIIKFDMQGLSFNIDDHIESNHYAQGSSVGDINGDGLLDYYVANDNGSNKSFINNSQELQEILIPELNILTGEDSEGNYNVLLFDPDDDGDLDVYVTKCHISAISFDDPRRINQFFENIEGAFVESSGQWGLDHGDQSWCSAAADLDNDGDQDLVLINHGTPIMLLENEGRQFRTHSEFSNRGEIIGDEQQVILEDFNNDGFVDIFIFGFNDQLLLNNGNLNFSSYNNPIGGSNAYSAACGDLNDDGWLDVLAVYGTAGSGIDDRLWINFGGNRHHIKFSLNGRQSNALGVSSRVTIYANGESQTRWINSGSSYGITNSLTAHFGLGSKTKVDSVIIFWPSGLQESYSDLDSDHHYIITEDVCLEKRADLIPSSYQIDCFNDPISLNSTVPGNYRWINYNGDKIMAADEKNYYYGLRDEVCRNATGIILIDSLRHLIQPQLLSPGIARLCPESTYLLLTKDGMEYEWPDGSYSRYFPVNEPGKYFAMDAHQCDTLRSDTFIYENISFLTDVDQVLVSREGTDVRLNPGLGPVLWIDGEFNFLDEAPEYIIDTLSMDTVFYFMQFDQNQLPSFSVGPSIVTDSLSLRPADESIEMFYYFKTSTEVVSFDVYAENDGQRKFIIEDANGVEVFVQEYLLAEGFNQIDINLYFPRGQYKIFTDSLTNLMSLDQSGPGLYSLNNSDIETDDRFIEFNPDNETSVVFCFNWQLKYNYARCVDRPYAFEVKLDTTTSVHDMDQAILRVFPNPGPGPFRLLTEEEIDFILLFNSAGQKIYGTREMKDGYFDPRPEGLPSGTYFLIIAKGDDRRVLPLIISP